MGAAYKKNAFSFIFSVTPVLEVKIKLNISSCLVLSYEWLLKTATIEIWAAAVFFKINREKYRNWNRGEMCGNSLLNICHQHHRIPHTFLYVWPLRTCLLKNTEHRCLAVLWASIRAESVAESEKHKLVSVWLIPNSSGWMQILKLRRFWMRLEKLKNIKILSFTKP